MNRRWLYILLPLFATSLCYCDKGREPSPSGALLQSYLIDGTWQLTSSSSYNSNGALISRQIGSLADTLIFGFAAGSNSNIVPTNLISFFNGTQKSFNYSLNGINATIAISPVWKIGYTDTISIPNFSDYNMTLKINAINSSSVAFELDSLKKVRFY